MTYQEIKKKHQESYDKILNDCGVFWAFNTEQFKEGLEKSNLKEGEKLVNIGMGGYLPKNNLDKFLKETKEADKAEKKALKEAREEKENAILYELNNYECFYTNDIEQVVEIFKGIYNKNDIQKVFANNRCN